MRNFGKKIRAAGCAALLFAASLLASAPAGAEVQTLYTAKISTHFPNSTTNVYSHPDLESKVLANYKPGRAIEVVEVLPNFVGIKLSGKIGYVLRHRIMDPVALDKASTPRFGTALNLWFATLSQETHVKAAPESASETLITLQAGAQLGFLDVTNGWARLIFKRQYGYVDTRELDALEMVAPVESNGSPEVPIAVYNSFYNISDSENNLNRINNLAVGGQRMSKVLAPGQTLDFNGEVGPFRASNGYKPAGALVDGEMVFDVYGGGSCQVSSTLYNAVLQLTGLTVLRRAPHGANGIAYLPHGVDASSGGLNFVFRNDYPFPVRIYAHVQDGSLFVAFYKESV